MMASEEFELIERYINGRLAAGDLGHLESLLRANGEARASLRLQATLEVGLYELASCASVGENADEELLSDLADVHSELESQALPGNRFSVFLMLAAIAASLLIAVGFILFRNGDNTRIAGVLEGNSEVMATLLQASNARWEGSEFSDGSPIRAQKLSLRSGIVRLQFVDGVEVTLQGPAKYEIVDVGHTRLLSGLLAANVPEGAEGFRVETPTVDVVDVGTSFGVRLSDRGDTNVAVFDGEVEIRPRGSPQARRIKEGEAVDVSLHESSTVASAGYVEIDTAPYEKIWPVASGIVISTDNFRFAPPWPRRLRFIRSDDEVSVIVEGLPAVLDSPLRVNVSEPGIYGHTEYLTPGEVPADTRVRSYSLHFKPESTSEDDGDWLQGFDGTITFDNPILGLIALPEELTASDKLFADERQSPRAPRYRALELRGPPNGDVVTVSDDRRSLTLRFTTPRRMTDRLRVIVDASVEQASNTE